MTHLDIIMPMAINVFYTFFLILISFHVKKKSIIAGETDGKYFKVYHSQFNVSDSVRLVERHYDNQFQLPILYYITGALFIALKIYDPLTVALMWLFLLTRIVHAYFHLQNRHILRRAGAYAAGWAVICTMWGYLVFTEFTRGL